MTLLRLRHRSISAKLRLLIALACVAVIALTAVAFLVEEWFSFRSSLLFSVAVRAQVLAYNAAKPLESHQPAAAEALLEAVKADPRTTSCVIFDLQDQRFAQYPRNLALSYPLIPVGTHRFGWRQLTVRVPISLAGQPQGSLLIAKNLGALYHRMAIYCAMALGFVGLASLIGFLLAERIQRALTEPILSLARAARLVAERKDYTIRTTRTADDEIGDLTDAFNSMLGQLQLHEQGLEEKVARRTTELRTANQELEAFSFSVAHDLRAPVRGMVGRAELILEDYGSNLPAPVQEHLAAIKRNGLRISQLIQDMLEFARTSRTVPVLEAIDIQAMVSSILAEFRPEIQSRGVELSVQELPPCRADPSLLRQVLVNLISNALKYTRGRSPARISIGSVAVPEAGHIGYYVQDNGIGFKMEDANRLFQPFERLHSAEKFEGTGVGLALAQRVIQRHDGRMWVEAAPEAGATFYFSLPTIDG